MTKLGPFLLMLLVVFLVTLYGCASTPAEPVLVPVVKMCTIEIDNSAEFPDTKENILGAENIAARVNLLLAGRLLRDARIGELEAALTACR